MKTWTIVLFPKIQVDTAVSYFLLKHFGESKFPGISQGSVEFWSELPEGKTSDSLEEEGYIVIDLGNGKFDHHRLGPENRQHSSSHLVAQHLQIEDRQDLARMLEFARRDDLEGRGTLSADPIDRAFGFSGLLTNLNKSIPDSPHKILEIIIPILAGHYLEENRRHEQLPAEFQALVAQGKIKEFSAPQLGQTVKVVYTESDNPALAGYIRSRAVGADLVIQRASTGHVNFITKQARRIRLHKLARLIKMLEAQKSGMTLRIDHERDLEAPGRTEGLPHWFYDTRANTLQNGGIQPQGIPATKLTYQDIEQATKQGLNIEREFSERPRPTHFQRGGPPQRRDPNYPGRFDKRRGVQEIL